MTTTLLLDDITKAAAFVALYFLLFLLAKGLKDIFTPYKINHELTKEDNLAIALTMCGYYLATAAIFIGAFLGPAHGFLLDLVYVGGYSLIGLVLLNASRWFNDKAILRKFCDTNQLIKEKNTSVGTVQCGAYIATGLIAAGAVSGQQASVLSAVVFFVLGQLALFIFSVIYEKLSSYDVHEELEKKNLASGIAFSGHLIALAIIVMNAAASDVSDWKQALSSFAIANIIAFIFLPIIRVIMDKLVVPGASLMREIKEDRNIGAGFLEATVAISFSVVLTRFI